MAFVSSVLHELFVSIYNASSYLFSKLNLSMDFADIISAKSGVDPSSCVELAKHVKLSCPNLVFSGLMTIGMPDCSSTPENFKVINSVVILRLAGKICFSAVRAFPFEIYINSYLFAAIVSLKFVLHIYYHFVGC